MSKSVSKQNKTAGFFQNADGLEPAKIFSNKNDFSRTEQWHFSRIAIKVTMTSWPGV